MKPASILAVIAAFLSYSAVLGNPVWTETFDNGVGRFNITTGQGETVFVHDPVDGNLDGTFVRRDRDTTPDYDRRLANLGVTLTEQDVIAFSFEFTPTAYSGQFPYPSLGFFDSQLSNEFVAGVQLGNIQGGVGEWYVETPGFSNPDPFFWSIGETYLAELAIDGPNNIVTFSTSIWTGSAFVLEQSRDWLVPSPEQYAVDRLGMSNILDEQMVGSYLEGTIDNFSFTPEPSTVLLLTAASLLALRRRHQAA